MLFDMSMCQDGTAFSLQVYKGMMSMCKMYVV